MIAISAVKKMAAEKSDIIFAPICPLWRAFYSGRVKCIFTFAPIRPLWRAFYSPEKSPAKQMCIRDSLMTIAHSTAESQAFLEEGGRISYEFLAAGRMGAGTDGWGRCFHGTIFRPWR